MLPTVTARFVEYDGPAKCRVGSPYAGTKCGKPAEIVTIFEGSNGWSYEAAPRCREDAIYMLGEVPLVA